MLRARIKEISSPWRRRVQTHLFSHLPAANIKYCVSRKWLPILCSNYVVTTSWTYSIVGRMLLKIWFFFFNSCATCSELPWTRSSMIRFISVLSRKERFVCVFKQRLSYFYGPVGLYVPLESSSVANVEREMFFFSFFFLAYNLKCSFYHYLSLFLWN